MTKKLSKSRLAAIIAAAVLLAVSLSLIIVNCFIPVKYLSGYFVSGRRAESGVMRVSFLDVGYGDCTVIELPDGKNLLIDAGDGSRSHTAKIIKSLNERDIEVIDFLICTSVNKEHCGGLAEILKYRKVNKIYSPYCTNTRINDEYRKFVLAAEASRAEVVINEYGAGEEGAGWQFKILSPMPVNYPDGEYAALTQDPNSATAKNNASAVVWLEYAGTGLLFAGDAETAVYENICNSYAVAAEDYVADLKKCKILKVAGHGSEKSFCEQLFELTEPEIAIISVGENGFGCPSESVTVNAAKYGKVYRTDEDKTVTVEVTADGYKEIT